MPSVNKTIDVRFAVRLYYERIWLTNDDIKKLFNINSSSTLARYRRQVLDYFADRNTNPLHRNNKLDTWKAYEAWGLDIEELEKRLRKLQKLNLQ